MDMLALSGIVFFLSVSGLPWMCGATVQSLNHVRAMACVRRDETTDKEVIENIVENRFSGFLIHAMILSSVLLLPAIRQIPMAVISGIFLYLGRKLMSGNQFLERLGSLVMSVVPLQRKSLEEREGIFRKLDKITIAKYVSIQTFMLGLIWALKTTPSLSIFFPSCIALLMITRVQILPNLFSDDDLMLLDSAGSSWENCRVC